MPLTFESGTVPGLPEILAETSCLCLHSLCLALSSLFLQLRLLLFCGFSSFHFIEGAACSLILLYKVILLSVYNETNYVTKNAAKS